MHRRTAEIFADSLIKTERFGLREYQETTTNVFILEKVPIWHNQVGITAWRVRVKAYVTFNLLAYD